MNTKRQTIWLVSMLSLMVVLSAYYLFSEDSSSKTDLLTEKTPSNSLAASDSTTDASGSDPSATEVTAPDAANAADPTNAASAADANAANSGNTADAANATNSTDSANSTDPAAAGPDDRSSEGTKKDGKNTQDNVKTDDGKKDDGKKDGSTKDDNKKAGDDKATSGAANDQSGKTDQEVLQQWESQGASSNYFVDLQQKNDQKYEEQYNKLMSQISKVDQDADTASAAVEELSNFEGQHDKIVSIQQKLTAQYQNAVIDMSGNNQYKVVVESASLDKSKAAAIIDLVMKEMGIGASEVSVQYVP